MDSIANTRSPLTTAEAINFLKHADDYNCISAPPIKPKAALVFLYKAPSVDKEGMCRYENNDNTQHSEATKTCASYITIASSKKCACTYNNNY